MEQLVGKVALVTGASSGIGFSLTKLLVEQGMKVIGCARNIKPLQELGESAAKESQKGSLEAVPCDLHHENEIKAMFKNISEKYGRLDVCINNAGLGKSAPLSSGETDSWREMLEINVLALSACSREAVQLMKLANTTDGHIVQISSYAAHSLPNSPDGSMYAASKHAVRALCQGLRNELKRQGLTIRVSCVSPALVETDFAIRMRGQERGTEMYKTMPSLHAEDVAKSVLFVLSSPPYMQVDDMLIRNVSE